MLSRLLGVVLGKTRTRALLAALAGAAAGWDLVRAGWPWWAALPAAILVTTAAFLGIVMLLYAYAKATLHRRTADLRRRLMRASSSIPAPSEGSARNTTSVSAQKDANPSSPGE